MFANYVFEELNGCDNHVSVRIQEIVWCELQHISKHRCVLATFVSIRFPFLVLSLAIK